MVILLFYHATTMQLGAQLSIGDCCYAAIFHEMDLEAFWPICTRGDWAPPVQTAMGEPYAPAPLLRLLGCMELTVRLATYSGHDATSKLQTLTSQCHYALTFHEECRASMHAHDDWHIFEDARATLDYVLIGEVECPLAVQSYYHCIHSAATGQWLHAQLTVIWLFLVGANLAAL